MSAATDQTRVLANKLGEKCDSDILIINSGIEIGLDMNVFGLLAQPRDVRKNVVVFLCTEGGSADVAYRTMRHLQRGYANITIVVGGWCKSAGTLMCIGANNIVMSPLAELGPIDVQLAKTDELFESSSGLAIDSAFQKLQIESARLFITHVFALKDHFKSRMSFKTAVNAAIEMTNASIKPIFERFDPLSIGEDYRSYRIAEEYGVRLDGVAQNLRRDESFDALDLLLGGYPSHGFVIDFDEARDLFKRVRMLNEDEGHLLESLGRDAVVPRSSRRSEKSRVEYLNGEIGAEDGREAAVESSGGVENKTAVDDGTGPGNGADIPADHSEGVREEPGQANTPDQDQNA